MPDRILKVLLYFHIEELKMLIGLGYSTIPQKIRLTVEPTCAVKKSFLRAQRFLVTPESTLMGVLGTSSIDCRGVSS